MKLSHHVIAIALCSLLAACGGGGEDDSAALAPRASLDLTEFEGTWRVRPEIADCQADFDYNPQYFYRFNGLTTDNVNGTLRTIVSADIYDDLACSIKRGQIREQFTLNLLQGASSGRSNVIKATAVFTSSHSNPEDGLTLTLTKIPDGSFSGFVADKFLIDRDGDRLYVTQSSRAPALDHGGYPTTVDTTSYMIR